MAVRWIFAGGFARLEMSGAPIVWHGLSVFHSLAEWRAALKPYGLTLRRNPAVMLWDIVPR